MGERRVKANTSGGERVRLSAAFTACADGEKLKVISIYKTQITFDTDVIIKYFERIVIPYMGRLGLEWVLFILDSATCHGNETVKKTKIK